MHSNFHHNNMLNRYRQTGAFILVTVVFLMAAGGAMLYAMSNLSSVSSTTATLAHNGNMALAAAQSGLKYCVAAGSTCSATPLIDGISTPASAPSPCKITITATPASNCSNAVSAICTITSTACCPNSADPYHGAKKLKIQVQNTLGVYQLIPASREVVTPDTCPL